MNPDRELIEHALPGYDIGVELGRGAWGVVLSGRHKRLGRKVAIKQLPRAFAADPDVSERFLREAQMAASLDHPHIVPVYDYVEDDALALIVMEQCPGTVAGKFRSEGIHTDEACAAALATCSALSYAHGRGVLHRDIKPENLLLDEDGVIKLGDFGIARALDAAVRLTATGTVVGTPAYMSPEQAGGEDLLATSDVYSLGVVLYELLSGSLPFEDVASWGALLRQHMFEPPTPLLQSAPDIPNRIAAVVDRALTKQPSDRWQSANEFGVALAEATSHAFGAGWLRQRRFALLSAPDIIAATERNVGGDGRGGTMVVRGSSPAVPTAGPPPADGSGATQVSTPPGGTPSAPPVPGTPSTPPPPTPGTGSMARAAAAASQDLSAVVPPVSPPTSTPGAETPPQPPPASVVAGEGSNNYAWRVVAIAGAVVVAVAVLGVLAVMALSGGDDDPATDQVATDDGGEEPDIVDDATEAPEPTVSSTETDDGASGDDDGASDDGATGDDGAAADDGAATDDGAAGDDGAPPSTGNGEGLIIGSLLDTDEFARDEDKQVTMDLAAADINEAGGVLGQPVTYLETPYLDDAELIVGATQLDAAGASAIVGPTDAVDTNDVLATVTGAGMILVSPTDFFSRPDESGLYFQTRIPQTLLGPAAVSLIPDGITNVTIITENGFSSLDDDIEAELLAALERSGYVGTSIEAIDDDWATAVAAIPATAPDLIMIQGIIGLTDLYNTLIGAGYGPADIPIINVGNDGGAVDMGDGQITGVRGISRDALTGNLLEPRLPASDLSADAAQAYDAVIIIALAAEEAGSTDPAAIAAAIPVVTGGGQECTTFAECRDLIVAGTDIDYVGPGGPYEISPETGRPTAGAFRVATVSDSGFSSGQSEPYVFRTNG